MPLRVPDQMIYRAPHPRRQAAKAKREVDDASSRVPKDVHVSAHIVYLNGRISATVQILKRTELALYEAHAELANMREFGEKILAERNAAQEMLRAMGIDV